MNKLKKSILNFGNSRSSIFKDLSKFCNGKILDIGCGQGAFINQIKDFSNKEFYGIDINKLENPKYKKIIQGSFLRLSKFFPEHFFDSMFGIAVLEHTHNPVKFLIESNKVLKIGGKLILMTDNPYRFYTLIANVFLSKGAGRGGNTKVIDGGHVNFLVPRMLNALASELGFTLISLKYGRGFNFPLLQRTFTYIYEKKRDLDNQELKKYNLLW